MMPLGPAYTPLAQETHVRSFDSAKACEAYRDSLIKGIVYLSVSISSGVWDDRDTVGQAFDNAGGLRRLQIPGLPLT
jgi:hypothetical protein